MKHLTKAIVASTTLFLSACDKPAPKQQAQPSSPELAAGSFTPFLVDSRALPAIQNFPLTVSVIQSISDDQRKSFLQNGVWVTEDKIQLYEKLIWEAISKDLFKKPLDTTLENAYDNLLSGLHKSGFHVYPSLMSIENQPYFNVVLFKLGEVKQAVELTQLKQLIGLNNRPDIGMRELVEAFSTEQSESLYGAPGKDGNILVNPSVILRDQDIQVRDVRALFDAVLINELAHIKIQEAETTGRQKAVSMELEEAYSDYWTLKINPKEEILFSTKDILGSTTLRYQDSKQFAVKGIEDFCKKKIPNFTKLENNFDNFERLIQIPENLELLQACLINAYRVGLIESGINSDLF